jgi:carboxymethylenebutenolidase
MRVLRICSFALIATSLAAPSALAQNRERVMIDGGRLSGILYTPASTPAPAVIVLHTAYGSVEEADEKYAAALAKEGFVALAPNYLEIVKDKLWQPAIDQQLRGVVSWLVARREVANKPVGTVGFSLGAHGVSLSALDPRLKAVVVYYGAYDARAAKRVPNLAPTVKLPIDYAAGVSAPVLLLHGENDDEIPVSNAHAMEAALKAAGKPVELVVYPGAYHRFDRGDVVRSGAGRRASSFTYRYDAAATRDAWARTLAFFKEKLGS